MLECKVLHCRKFIPIFLKLWQKFPSSVEVTCCNVSPNRPTGSTWIPNHFATCVIFPFIDVFTIWSSQNQKSSFSKDMMLRVHSNYLRDVFLSLTVFRLPSHNSGPTFISISLTVSVAEWGFSLWVPYIWCKIFLISWALIIWCISLSKFAGRFAHLASCDLWNSTGKSIIIIVICSRITNTEY